MSQQFQEHINELIGGIDCTQEKIRILEDVKRLTEFKYDLGI